MSQINLSTTYLGLNLKSPLVASASPLSENIDDIKRLEDAGASAVVLHSLFEEQLRMEEFSLHHHTTKNTHSFSEAMTFFPEPSEFQLGPEEYLTHIRRAKQAVQIPIIGSLNGSTMGGWTSFAKKFEQAGADAIELNLYHIPTDPRLNSEKVEHNYIEIVQAVKSAVKIPVAVKLSPFFSNMAHMANKLDKAGANALVLFNRFYQPDIDLEELSIQPSVILSGPQAIRLPLRWIAILHGKLTADLAATSGIHKASDVIKMVMVGANVTMLCSVLLRYGIDQLKVIEADMIQWMSQREYQSVEQMRGSMSQLRCENPSAFERAQYIRALQTFKHDNPSL